VSDPRRQLELVYARNDLQSRGSLAAYLDCVKVDSRPDPRPFGQIAEPWQRDRNTWVVPAFEFVAGVREQYDGPKNFWLGYSKGHDKSSYIARNLNWAAAYARRPLRMYCCAKDSEQANVIYDAMKREAELNPWFAKRLEFKRNQVAGKDSGARVEILASDAAGAHGKTPDVIVYDELCHWDSRDLWDSLQTAKVKRGGYCLTVVATNAGYRGSWQHDIRNNAERSPNWFFYEQPQGVQLASWMSADEIAAESENITEHEARRLFKNCWIDLSEVGLRFLSPDAIDRCVGCPLYPPAGARVVLGIDYGGVHDRTSLAAVWWDGERLHVFEMLCLQGSPENEVQIAEVSEWVEEKFRQFPDCTAVFDRFQLLETIQRLERAGRDVRRFEYRGGKQNHAMAVLVKNLVQNRKILFGEATGLCGGESLAGEMKRLVVRPMNYGFRLDHAANGFDDKTISVGMAATEAVDSDALAAPARGTKPKEPEAPRPRLHLFSGEHFRRRELYGLK
jgi:hypothetical protein